MKNDPISEIPRHKVPYSAVCLVPPKDLWPPIQAIRREHDPQIHRWMPHVTLLYPFLMEEYLRTAATALQPVCASFDRFAITLESFSYFEHDSGIATMYAKPVPAEPICKLHECLRERMPWCDDVDRFESGFTPHLSVGRFPAQEAESARQRLEKDWSPIRWEATHVCVIARSADGSGPFSVAYTLPLGDSEVK